MGEVKKAQDMIPISAETMAAARKKSQESLDVYAKSPISRNCSLRKNAKMDRPFILC
jgi:hypothetical protein